MSADGFLNEEYACVDKAQMTLVRPVRFEGVGLHSGAHCVCVVEPAPAGRGVEFICEDGPGARAPILVQPDAIVGSDHATTLANAAGARVSTIEHLLAALTLMGVDNATIRVWGGEAPILDGSAEPFVAAFRKAGLRALGASRIVTTLSAPIRVDDGERFIELTPARALTLDVSIDFDGCLIGRQRVEFDMRSADCDAELDRLSRARTFCRLDELDALRDAGLIRGGSLDNAVVVDGQKLVNGEGLRDPAEFALHKALDLLGDFALLGGPLRAHIRAHRPGHDLNARAVRAVAQAQACAPAYEMAVNA